jgi:glycosyltransferase EpsD
MEHENFQIVHCNTPIGGALGRIAAKRHHVNAVIYQAHGFHFYQGAPWTSWVLYYPIEKILTRYSDCIITINKEDYELARKQLRPRLSGKVVYVPGIGIDIHRYASTEIEPAKIKEEYGIPDDAIVAISVGELNRNKNHEIILRSIQSIPHVHYLIAGIGPLHEKLVMLARELSIADRVHFLGFRTDIPHIFRVSDIFCLPSYREGLSASLMEAMASGLPVICSDIRGNRDLVLSQGGYLINPDDVQGFTSAMNELVSSNMKRAQMGTTNQKIIEAFSINQVVPMMRSIYTNLAERTLQGASG